jgi:glyoxylase-like metal-dependent hydrolase (beta-lactamase superfamily II)
MELLIKIIKNHPIDSNCFILYNDLDLSCIIVDPGTEDCKELLFFLEQNKLLPKCIILTHEHFDHIYGVNRLLELFDSVVVCSEKCFEIIADKKKNLSIFYNQIGFEVKPKKIKLVSNEILLINKFKLQFKETPGHSLGSVSFWINDYVFVGDVFIKDTRTVTKLPGGSKKQLTETIYELNELFSNKNMIVYPGHGEIFPFNDVDFSKVI